ncbi:DUF6357 family protein [Brachybacterium paraconglomeratum]
MSPAFTSAPSSPRSRLEVVGGADALHDPRLFTVPLREEHLTALRASVRRHVLLQAVLLPLCYEAGIREDWDEQAAAALLDPILLSSPEEIDATMRDLHVDRRSLVAHRASIPHLPEHVALTLAEPGCLRFAVEPTEDPLVWSVSEQFVDRPAFDAHQARVRSSAWFATTSVIARDYVVTVAGSADDPTSADDSSARSSPEGRGDEDAEIPSFTPTIG